MKQERIHLKILKCAAEGDWQNQTGALYEESTPQIVSHRGLVLPSASHRQEYPTSAYRQRFAASAAVRHKAGNCGSLDAFRRASTTGVPESVPVRASKCPCRGGSIFGWAEGGNESRHRKKLFARALCLATIFVSCLNVAQAYSPPSLANTAYISGPFINTANLVGQCTWYCYGRIQEVGLKTSSQLASLPNRNGGTGIFLGNASTWVADATAAGFSTGSTPQVGALAVWVSANHVAFVESVSGPTIQVSECNNTPTSGANIVVGGAYANLRASASTSGTLVWQMPQFTVMTVTGAPTTANGYQWYPMSGNGKSGWVAWLRADLAGPAETSGVNNLWWNITRFDNSPASVWIGASPTYIYLASPPVPSMALNYNGTAIPNGDASPSTAKGTDFGTVTDVIGSSTRTFTINNTGSGALNLTGTPRVQFSGSNPSDFGMTAQPSTPVSANVSTTFTLIFQPTTGETGLRTAIVTIPNNDPNKNPYTFLVQGTAQAQQRIDPSLEYNGVTIANGDQSPTVSKGTDFSSVNVGSQSSTHSFQFYNYGNIDMTLTGSMVQLSGANSGDFAIVSMPSSPIAPNQYATIGIRFQPTGSGLRTANLLIYFDPTYGLGATSPYTVALQGTGVVPNISVTVQPNQSGRSFTVDGVSYSTGQTFIWVSGGAHTIAGVSPQSGGTGIQYVWSSWSDSGAISHSVAPTTATTYTVNYTTQYYMTMGYGVGGSSVSPGSDWYSSGISVGISATATSGYSFSSWTGGGPGNYSGSVASSSVTMNGPITETANFTLNPVSVIVQANPAGRSFTVDGTAYTSAQAFSWVPGSGHTIATISPQSGASGVQYLWSSWSDGLGISHMVTPTTTTTYTANFTTQYYLTTGYGTGGSGVSPGSGWYNSGNGVGITATAASGYTFSSWAGSGTGNYSGSVASSLVTMNGPISETANFVPQTRIIGLGGNLIFGNVQTGLTATATLTINSTGNATLNVSSISYPAGFSGAWSGPIAANSSQNVTVTFAPTAVTSYNGTVTVNSDKTSGTSTINASGVGIGQTSLPQLSGMAMSNKVFRFNLNGLVGSNYVIKVSSNLLNWLPLSTNTIPASGSTNITDPSATNKSLRFYRAVPMIGPISGTVIAWGLNTDGQTNVPPGLTNAMAVAGGYKHSLALKSDGTVIGWGSLDYDATNPPAGLSNVTAIAAGWGTSLALKSDGTLAEWGEGDHGLYSTAQTLTNITAISASWDCLMALKGDGTVAVWGNSQHGESNVPPGLSGVIAIAGGGYHCLALKNDGTVVAWGDNGAGQTNVPAGLTGVTKIAAGGSHSIALKADGTVIAWGDNSYGQTSVPLALANVIAISGGRSHSLALKADGTVIGWGDNSDGQTSPPPGLTNVTVISAGGYHNLSIKTGP